MKAYIVPDWMTIVAGLVIFQTKPELKVLLGIRSAREEKGKWCLPMGLGVIKRDISGVLAQGAPSSLDDPMKLVQFMSERHKEAILSPAGFALAEARWYVDIPPAISAERLSPLKAICRIDKESLLVRAYFGLKWDPKVIPKPATSEWPFAEVRFFSRKELKGIPIAFSCDKDLEEIFWP